MENLIAKISSRDQLPALLKVFGLNGAAVEVGVETGEYSKIILAGSNLAKLYSVDSWKEYPPTEYRDINNLSQGKHDRNWRLTRETLASFGTRSEILRLSSAEAALHFPDVSLDFIYIDANHGYRECAADLASWWPKLRIGGVFAGHDFVPYGIYEQGEFGVQRAVIEFVNKYGLEFFLTQDSWPTWWLRKKDTDSI